MNLSWLNKQNNDKLIIFFNGWGMDDNVVKSLDPGDYDILTICDYNKLDPVPDCSKYTSVHVVAWSMGVMIATLYNFEHSSATAINGTFYPIHAEYGINPRVYKLMELGFDENSRRMFIENMFDNPVPNDFILPARDIISQKSELTALKQYKANENYKYTRVITSRNDKIIPAQSQFNYWKTPEIINTGHYPFYNFKNWEELL